MRKYISSNRDKEKEMKVWLKDVEILVKTPAYTSVNLSTQRQPRWSYCFGQSNSQRLIIDFGDFMTTTGKSFVWRMRQRLTVYLAPNPIIYYSVVTYVILEATWSHNLSLVPVPPFLYFFVPAPRRQPSNSLLVVCCLRLRLHRHRNTSPRIMKPKQTLFK